MFSFQAKPEYQNPQVLSVGREPAHAPWGAYEDAVQARACDRDASQYVLSLEALAVALTNNYSLPA